MQRHSRCDAKSTRSLNLLRNPPDILHRPACEDISVFTTATGEPVCLPNATSSAGSLSPPPHY